MFTKDELIKELLTDRNKGFIERIAAEVQQHHFKLNELIDLTFDANKQIGFRAAWLLDVTLLADPEQYVNYLTYFVKRMPEVSNASCKRHYARIMMHLTATEAPKSIKHQFEAMDMESVVETCFDWLIDPRVKVAVKVWQQKHCTIYATGMGG